MGKEVKELIDSMYGDVEHLEEVAVDPKRWPRLTKWCRGYTQHRVNPNSRKKW
jgi:hypothetical protein